VASLVIHRSDGPLRLDYSIQHTCAATRIVCCDILRPGEEKHVCLRSAMVRGDYPNNVGQYMESVPSLPLQLDHAVCHPNRRVR
jgi:hypothetical protein